MVEVLLGHQQRLGQVWALAEAYAARRRSSLLAQLRRRWPDAAELRFLLHLAGERVDQTRTVTTIEAVELYARLAELPIGFGYPEGWCEPRAIVWLSS